MKTLLITLGSTGVYAVGASIVCCRVNRHVARPEPKPTPAPSPTGRHRSSSSRSGGIQ